MRSTSWLLVLKKNKQKEANIMTESKTINLKEPIFVTLYGDTIAKKYTKLNLATYPYPKDSHDRGLLLLPDSNNDDEILIVSVNLYLHLPENKIAININDDLIKKQVLPELIKQKIITAEVDFSVPSGYNQYPIHTILI
jgi:hypothetical protein